MSVEQKPTSEPAVPDLRPHFQTLEDLAPPPLDLPRLFGNDKPVELEVGTGRGLFLLNAALTVPETNFLGVEYDFKEARRGAKRLHKRQLSNARIIGADANILLPKFISNHSMAAVHVYFPDPWWKRRHKKRRIFNSTFVSEVARILRIGGLLHSWTDVEEYYHEIVRLVGENPAFDTLPPPDEREANHDMDYHTSFERKKRKLGLPIFRARWKRREAMPE